MSYKILCLLLIVIPSLCYSYCFEEAGAMYGISPQLLWAIAKVESNFIPYAVNYNSNGTYDYGVMQINSNWAKHFGADLWRSLADPCINVKVGAYILAQCIRKHGYTWKAVGCYNSPNQKTGQKYAHKVYSALITNSKSREN